MERKKTDRSRYFSIESLKAEFENSPDNKGKGKAAGVDWMFPSYFKKNLDKNIKKIVNEIRSDNFGFRRLRVHKITKDNGKLRAICIPTVRDRLVQRRIVDVLTKDNKKKHLQDKFGLNKKDSIAYGLGNSVRENSRVKDAIVDAITRRKELPWVLKTDIQKFFDDIDRQELIKRFRKKYQKSSLVDLVEKAINCEVEKKELKDSGLKEGVGIRQGMPLSPILSNLFLEDFDEKVSKEVGQKNIIRYADDIIVFAASEKRCEELMVFIENELKLIGLSIPSLLDKSKTEIVKPNEQVTFLGIEIYKIPNSEGYEKRIGKKKRQEIENLFKKESTFEHAIQKKPKLTFPRLLQSLDNKIRGYEEHYDGTDDFDDLIKNLKQIKIDAQKTIVVDIFGADIFDKLSPDQKEFLGFPK